MNRRKNYAEGRFYPGSAREIEAVFEDALSKEEPIREPDGRMIGGIAPHAGYVYCARVGVHLFKNIRRKGEEYDTVILLNPNHTGYGKGVEIDGAHVWTSPLGEVEIDHELGDLIYGERGEDAQRFEHSGEVILPYLQYFIEGKFKLLPICVRDYTYPTARRLAESIVEAVEKTGRRIFLMVSSDFNHFKSRAEGRALDDYALEALMKLDSEAFYRRIVERDISICGLGPIMVLTEYMKLSLKNPSYEILRRGDSGEVTGDREVVDYISLAAMER